MNDLTWVEDAGAVVIVLPAFLPQADWLAFREQVQRQFIARGVIDLRIDCGSCQHLPSIAYGAFVGLSRDAHRLGGSFLLTHVSEKARQVMFRTRLDLLLPTG